MAFWRRSNTAGSRSSSNLGIKNNYNSTVYNKVLQDTELYFKPIIKQTFHNFLQFFMLFNCDILPLTLQLQVKFLQLLMSEFFNGVINKVDAILCKFFSNSALLKWGKRPKEFFFKIYNLYKFLSLFLLLTSVSLNHFHPGEVSFCPWEKKM